MTKLPLPQTDVWEKKSTERKWRLDPPIVRHYGPSPQCRPCGWWMIKRLETSSRTGQHPSTRQLCYKNSSSSPVQTTQNSSNPSISPRERAPLVEGSRKETLSLTPLPVLWSLFASIRQRRRRQQWLEGSSTWRTRRSPSPAWQVNADHRRRLAMHVVHPCFVFP